MYYLKNQHKQVFQIMKEFIPEQSRLAVDMADLYEGWLDAERIYRQGRLRWKRVADKDYLYQLNFGDSNGKSLGPRSPKTEALFEQASLAEQQAKEGWKRLLVKGRMAKAARLPVIDGFVGDVLRKLDAEGLLGEHLRVVGSFAIPAYEMEAGVRLNNKLVATEDFDLSWVSETSDQEIPPLLDALKEVDATWTVNQEKTFQVRNKALQMIDLVIAPQLMNSYPTSEKIRAIPIEGQQWLLGGQPVSHVVCDVYGKPCRIVAPDPRLFALHKLHMANVEGRNPFKREKDLQQADAILTLVEEKMPHYPLDEDFRKELAPELSRCLANWEEGRRPSPPSKASRVRLG